MRRDFEDRWKQPPEMFCKKGVLKNLTNFTGKHLYWSLLQLYLKQTPKQVFFL